PINCLMDVDYAPQRMLFCNDQANAWDTLCDGETITGTDTTRDAACLADKTADMGHTGSDTRCGMRMGVATACGIANPFAHVGCDNVVNIDSEVRSMYCTMQANTFKAGCKTDGTHDIPSGTTVANTRFVACLGSPVGDPADPLCATDSITEEGCGLDPFNSINTGCRNLMRFSEIVIAYCRDRNPDAEECKVQTSNWVASFGEGKAPPARLDNTVTAADRQRQFLTGGAIRLDSTGATAPTHYGLTLKSAMYSDEPLGGAGDTSDGYGFFYDTIAFNQEIFYAGLLSDTDLGAPLTQTDGSVTWYGQIQIYRNTALSTNHDFQLKITFGMKSGVNGSVGSIEGIVKDGLRPHGNSYYQLKGTYDAGGVISGTVDYDTFTGSPLVAATPNVTNGILTGLIGEQGAVGGLLRADAGSTNDNIIGA
ncbi:MAG: hypothetical protein K8953_07840, partial [Proteobacteria bacterium]|nr:hypothetical protein [Pseudomonadota bacterium]